MLFHELKDNPSGSSAWIQVTSLSGETLLQVQKPAIHLAVQLQRKIS
jgi:hypothetical protein